MITLTLQMNDNSLQMNDNSYSTTLTLQYSYSTKLYLGEIHCMVQEHGICLLYKQAYIDIGDKKA